MEKYGEKLMCISQSLLSRIFTHESRTNEIKHVQTDKPIHEFKHKNV